MAKSSNKEITEFLVEAKKLITAGRFDFVPRRKNMKDLAALGITIRDAKNEILSLQSSDYYKGPEEDQDINKPGSLWIFKKIVYITSFT